ncbi:MAG: 4Fe-4S dicluster domain-containing protein, partial [Pseudomonadales bacterium]
MQTELPAALLATDRGRRADEILRSCVHCGFCNATCPTYQLLGDELDGPRGRIYLIKDLLETGTATPLARTHLDRCLTCRACETTCPSGVQYGELLEIGRETLEAELPRPPGQRWLRRALLTVVPRPRLFARLAPLGRAFRWLLPARLRNALPPAPKRV